MLLNASYDICILVSKQTVNWVSFPSQRFSSSEDKKAATLSIKYTPNKTSSERKYRGKKTEFWWLGSRTKTPIDGNYWEEWGVIETVEIIWFLSSSQNASVLQICYGSVWEGGDKKQMGILWRLFSFQEINYVLWPSRQFLYKSMMNYGRQCIQWDIV